MRRLTMGGKELMRIKEEDLRRRGGGVDRGRAGRSARGRPPRTRLAAPLAPPGVRRERERERVSGGEERERERERD